ncbi:hypothetical protein SRRS_14770 [Sporomusa rhizae]|uniref:hypothetical protein n=1 Tax=Sporomusa rhizae TaxID=357999 RepID=UPI00352ADFD5
MILTVTVILNAQIFSYTWSFCKLPFFRSPVYRKLALANRRNQDKLPVVEAFIEKTKSWVSISQAKHILAVEFKNLLD